MLNEQSLWTLWTAVRGNDWRHGAAGPRARAIEQWLIECLAEHAFRLGQRVHQVDADQQAMRSATLTQVARARMPLTVGSL